MPIITKCSECGKKLRAPDEHAGKQAKCPQCKNIFKIGPAGGGSGPGAAAQPDRAEWYVQTSEGDEYGPVSKADLNQWLEEERLDADCQLLKEGWEQWKWAEAVFPQLASAGTTPVAATQENPFAGAGEANPYAVPQTPSASEEAAGDGAITQKIVRSMQGTVPWVMFFAVLYFLAAGIYLLLMLFSLLMNLASPVVTIIQFLLLGFYAALAGFLGYRRMTYSRRASEFARTKGTPQLEKALDAQRKFWKTAGIMMLVAIGTNIVFGILFVVRFGSMAAFINAR